MAPDGDDGDRGTRSEPWATLEHASAAVPDQGCVVWFEDGVYRGRNSPERRYSTLTTFRSVHPYRAVFENDEVVLALNGVRNVVIEGFEFRHAGPGAHRYVVVVDRRDGDLWAENVILRDNIFHDSYDNDLLKIHNGVRGAVVEGNVFYNQGPTEQHMDVNSVTDVVVQDNVFFNDYAASGRDRELGAKHLIVVKDSNEGDDGLFGSERIVIRRNVFLNWEGGREAFVQIGNDGKAYHEAKGVAVENNLMIGNSTHQVGAAFGVSGARDISFVNNTVVGDLPSGAYAMRIETKRENPRNENIRLTNNIWSDPTRSMGARPEGRVNNFSNGDPSETEGLLLRNNLYWNGGAMVPTGDLVSPHISDIDGLEADPGLNTDHTDIVVPVWSDDHFVSGNLSIRDEFVRLVRTYAAIPPNSPPVGRADPRWAPVTDILGRARGASPDMGAYQAGGQP